MTKFLRSSVLILFCYTMHTSCDSPTVNKDLQEKNLVYASIGNNPVDQDLSERKYTLMEREIEYLLTIWSGEYDNVEQLSFEKDAGRNTVEKGQHERIHHTITRVHHESLSEYLVYIEEYQNNDTNDITLQQIYELIPEDESASIRIRQYDIKNGKELWRSKTAKIQIEKLNKSRLQLSQLCDLILQREGKEFIATTEENECKIENNSSSTVFQVKIGLDKFSYRTKKIQDSSNEKLSKREDWYVLDKARCFVCMIDFPREPGGRPVNTKYYVDMHDQGGQFEFDYDDGRHMVFTMRNTWSYGMQRNTFVIVIQEDSLDGSTLIYSWGSDGADRIGMNPGWIRIQCDLKNETNIRLQQGLRPDS